MGFLSCPCKVLLECLQKFPNPPAVQVLLSLPTAMVAAAGESLRLQITLEKLPEGPCPELLGNPSISSLSGFLCQKKYLWETGKGSRFRPSVWERRQSKAESQRNSSVPILFSPFLVEFNPLDFHCVFFYFWKAPLKKKIAAFYTSIIVMHLHVSLPLSIWNVSNKTRL